jgi:hypothetical protein
MSKYFQLVFENTGDSIPFISTTNVEVLEYYVDFLNSNSVNEFKLSSPYNWAQHLHNSRIDLDQLLENINRWLPLLANEVFEKKTLDGYFDQDYLNQLHSEWAKYQYWNCDIKDQLSKNLNNDFLEKVHSKFSDDIPKPRLASIISRMDMFDQYNNINTLVHAIETSFQRLKFTGLKTDWIEIKNKFSHDVLTNNHNHLQISFNHLGRTLYNKFLNYDDKLTYPDENTYNNLNPHLTLNLFKSQTVELSKEYIEWCNSNNRIPTGDNFNIGNIPDLSEKLHDYRLIIFRNVFNNNKFCIDLT